MSNACTRWLVLSALAWLAPVAAARPAEEPATPADTTMTLRGDEEGTIFKSLRIEGEDRIRIEFDRPALNLALDARKAPGLEFEIARSALARNGIDLTAPFAAWSAAARGPLFSMPWFERFATGSVVRFRPALEGVERWRLDVADSRGATVKSFEGSGAPPKEISWDGRTTDGGAAPPGLTYSYVLEAYDRAGNKRNFVGEGFDLPPYIVPAGRGFALLFAGRELREGGSPSDKGASPAPILLETASRINQSASAARPIRVEVTARSFDEARRTADAIIVQLAPRLLGDPLRLQAITTVAADAPDAGMVQITVGAE